MVVTTYLAGCFAVGPSLVRFHRVDRLLRGMLKYLVGRGNAPENN